MCPTLTVKMSRAMMELHNVSTLPCTHLFRPVVTRCGLLLYARLFIPTPTSLLDLGARTVRGCCWSSAVVGLLNVVGFLGTIASLVFTFASLNRKIRSEQDPYTCQIVAVKMRRGMMKILWPYSGPPLSQSLFVEYAMCLPSVERSWECSD